MTHITQIFLVRIPRYRRTGSSPTTKVDFGLEAVGPEDWPFVSQSQLISSLVLCIICNYD